MKDKLLELNAGCSALSWSTADGKHLWGRNLDFNRLTEGTKIIFTPRKITYYTCGNSAENNVDTSSQQVAIYATVGTGFSMLPSSPVLYDGMNEKGLMGGQLYYRNFAYFGDEIKNNTIKVQPPFIVFHILAQCATIVEAIDKLQNEISIINMPMFGTVPTIHWAFSDRSGEMVIVEPDKNGLSVYRNSVGVMTNSPSYAWHRLNLLNYVGIRDLDYDTLDINGDKLEQCFSGSGAQGLPGDWTSPSRFIRLAFLRKYATVGKDETEGISRMMHLFQSVAFPLGMVKVTEQGHVTEYDKDIVPYDYTIYTATMCAESLRFYWTTYSNQRIQCVDMNDLLEKGEKIDFDLGQAADIKVVSKNQ